MSDYMPLQTEEMKKLQAQPLSSQVDQKEQMREAHLHNPADPTAQWASESAKAPGADQPAPAQKKAKLSRLEQKKAANDAAKQSQLKPGGAGYSGVREIGADVNIQREKLEDNERAGSQMAQGNDSADWKKQVEDKKKDVLPYMTKLAAYDTASLEGLSDGALVAKSKELLSLLAEGRPIVKFWNLPDPDDPKISIRRSFEAANKTDVMSKFVEIRYFATKARCIGIINAHRHGNLKDEVLTAEERDELLPKDRQLSEEEQSELILGHVKRLMAENELEHNAGQRIYGVAGRDTYIHRGRRLDKSGTISKAISEIIPGAYDKVDAIQRGEISPVVKLHASQGQKYVEKGENVIQIDMAGSGFTEFMAKHKKFGGKSNFYLSSEKKAKLSEVEVAQQSGNIPNEIVRQAISSNYVAGFRERYGGNISSGPLSGLRHIRQKTQSRDVNGEQVTKTRTSMAGPQGTILGFKPGASNSGEYSIENLREYMLITAKEQLTPIFDEWLRQGASAQKKKIHLLIKGHSRGAVAAGEGAMMIKNWLYSDPQYSVFENYVKLELVQYDPVPGTGSASGVNELIDHESKTDYDGKMTPLGSSAETTVVYSLYTQHAAFFTPQTVLGAKRIILSTFNHDVGLDKADATQMKSTGPSRLGYTDARTGDVYRNSGLSELDEGIFFADENNVLVKIKDYETAEKIMGRYFSFMKGGTQMGRHSVIVDVLKAWFARRG